MTDSAPVTFTNAYRGTARGSRYEHWREEICRGLCNIDIAPGRDDIIDMHCSLTNLAPVAIAVASGASAIVGRSRQTTGDGSDAFTLVCHPVSPLPFHHHGKTDSIGPADILLGDLTQASGATLDDCKKFTALVIDRKALLGASRKAEDLMFRPIRADDGLSQMIGRYAAMASEIAPRINAHGRFLMGQHLVDLVSLALGASPEEAQLAHNRGHAQARLALMKADILAGLSRGDLNIGTVAHRYGLSGRQAQRLFEQDGTTFTEFLLEQRLLLVRKLLLDPTNNGRKISDIAQSAGFSDQSYFNRAFRRRFLEKPSDIRNGT